jgi:hypothetical protein
MHPTLFFKCEARGGYFEGRDLGAVLDQEEPLSIRHAIKCGSSCRIISVASLRVSAMDTGTDAPAKFDGTTSPR